MTFPPRRVMILPAGVAVVLDGVRTPAVVAAAGDVVVGWRRWVSTAVEGVHSGAFVVVRTALPSGLAVRIAVRSVAGAVVAVVGVRMVRCRRVADKLGMVVVVVMRTAGCMTVVVVVVVAGVVRVAVA